MSFSVRLMELKDSQQMHFFSGCLRQTCVPNRQRGQPWLLIAVQFNYPRFIVIIALSCLVKGISQFRTLKTQSFFCCVMLKNTLDEPFEAPLMGTHSLKGHTSPRLWENSPFIYKSHETALGNCEKLNHHVNFILCQAQLLEP